jgi:site-specific DNA-methyltransferase (cytosine-N4-specific)
VTGTSKRAWVRPDGRARLFQADGRDLGQIPSASVGVILTSPPYWVSNRGRQAAEHYARQLAVGFGREWRRVLVPDGDLWLVLGDRHNGREWVGFDGLIAGWLRRTGWRLQSKGIWAETGSRERWDNRINYLLRFARAGRRVRPTAATLCWMLPLPRTHPASIWDATPEPVLRALILQSRRRGPVLDPFCGAGTVGRVALGLGREWIGVERDPRMAELTARRLGMTRERD